MSPDMEEASFEEQDFSFGCSGKRRVFRKPNCSVWLDSDGSYIIRLKFDPNDNHRYMHLECNFEECMNFIKSRIYE